MTKTNNSDELLSSRRDFIRTSTAAAVGTTLGVQLKTIPGASAAAAGSSMIKVGVIGCGGRGTGAAKNVLTADSGVKIVAMGDVFKDHLDESRKDLVKSFPGRVEVPDDRLFVGFDAYEKVLAQPDVNYVILATPPGFRPAHLQAAVAAGKTIFTEKPVAVDGPGIRTVLAAYEAARAKGLAIAAGTQRRHQTGYIETMKRIHDGAIGEITAARCYWNQGGLWVKPRQKSWSDMEWQLRNWLYFTWLSGDHIVEQHVHNIDVVNWATKSHPVRATGMGGRQSRTDPAYGHIYDHFTVDYEYENGLHLLSMCRQIPGADKNVSEALTGTRGECQTNATAKRYIITGKDKWRFGYKDNKADDSQQDNEPYVQEHIDLIRSVRSGKPINELKEVAESTLTAIMGRMSAYTGKTVTWEQALNSQENLLPAKLAWGPLPVPPVAIPGQTTLS